MLCFCHIQMDLWGVFTQKQTEYKEHLIMKYPYTDKNNSTKQLFKERIM